MPKRDWCTMFPDGNYGNCCKRHDYDYSKVGTKTRIQADKDLRACVEEKSSPMVARIIYLGVRAFGWLFWKRS